MLFAKKYVDERPTQAPSTSQCTLGPSAVRSEPPVRVDATTRSVVDPCLHITGNMEGRGDLQIDGHVIGNIKCTHLIIGHDATIDGSVAADQVVVRGRVKGIVRANCAILRHGARVDGDIFHRQLAIEAGAYFHGASRCRDNPLEEQQAEAEQPQAVEPAHSVACPAKVDVAAVGVPAHSEIVEPVAAKPQKPTRSTRHVAMELERLRAHKRPAA